MKKKRNLLTIISSILGVFAICGFSMLSIFSRSKEKSQSVSAEYHEPFVYSKTQTGYKIEQVFDSSVTNLPMTCWYVTDGLIRISYVESSETFSVRVIIDKILVSGNSNPVNYYFMDNTGSSSTYDLGSLVLSEDVYRVSVQFGRLSMLAGFAYQISYIDVSFYHSDGSTQIEHIRADNLVFNGSQNLSFLTNTSCGYYNVRESTFHLKSLQLSNQSGYSNGFNYALSTMDMPFYSANHSISSDDVDNVIFRKDLSAVQSTYTRDKVAVCDGYIQLQIDNTSVTKNITLTANATYLRLNDEVLQIVSNRQNFIVQNISHDITASTKIYLSLRDLSRITTNQYYITFDLLFVYWEFQTEVASSYSWTIVTESDFADYHRVGYDHSSDFVIDYNLAVDVYRKAYDVGYNDGWAVGIATSQGDYQDGYLNGYNLGFAEAESFYTSTQESVYNNGYNAGYGVGFSDGKASINEGEIAYQNYQEGYADGYEEGHTQNEAAATIFSGILQVAMVPVNFFLAIFNFEILGINLSAFIRAIFTVVLTIIVLKTVLGKGGGGSDN